MPVVLREATNADAPAVRHLVFGVLADHGLEPDPAETDRDLDDLAAHYRNNRGWFAVLEEDGTVVGSYGLYRVDDSTCELRKMYLAPTVRGRGWGRRLLEDALAQAGRLGCTTICLETASVLHAAIALYRRYGFEPYAAAHLSPRCDQAYRRGLPGAADPHDLRRFVDAQAPVYAAALAELRAGRKRTHWMWFVFPQAAGLGASATAQRYAIGSRAEAVAYLAHPLLGTRLRECAAALLAVEGRGAEQIMGFPDVLKLRSSMTLFAALAEPGDPFAAVLKKYYGGERCARTLAFFAAPAA